MDRFPARRAGMFVVVALMLVCGQTSAQQVSPSRRQTRPLVGGLQRAQYAEPLHRQDSQVCLRLDQRVQPQPAGDRLLG